MAGGRFKIYISLAAPAAFGSHKAFSVFGQISQYNAGGIVYHHGAQGNFYGHIVCLMPRAIFRGPVAAFFRYEFPFIAEIHQRIQVFISHQHHVTAPAAIAPVGTAVSHKFFSPETGSPVAPSTCFHINSCLICKQHGTPLPFSLPLFYMLVYYTIDNGSKKALIPGSTDFSQKV